MVFKQMKSTFSDISGGKFYWGSISGLDTDAIDDYDLPFIEVTYDESAEYIFYNKNLHLLIITKQRASQLTGLFYLLLHFF